MKKSEIYRKTLTFSLRRLLLSAISLLCIFGLPVAAFLIVHAIAPENDAAAAIAASAAFVIGIIAACLISHFLSYLLEAGQIAMITEGVTEGAIPDNTYEAGKQKVKSRFATVAIYYVVTKAISGILRQVTNGLTKLTEKATKNNDTLKTIGSLINLIVSIILHYVSSCSLAWLFAHPEQSSFKSVCDGSVLYFQNWKTLLKNVGVILLIGILSLAIIFAPLTVGVHAVFDNESTGIHQLMDTIVSELKRIDTDESSDFIRDLDGDTLLWISCAVIAFAIWLVIHNTFIEPYILIGVLQNYIRAAEENPPRLDVYGKLCNISSKFKNAFARSREEVPAAGM